MDRELFQKEIGDKLRKERKARGLTIEKTAAILGLSPSYLGLVERGERCLSLARLVKFCNFFGVSADYLLIGGDNRKGYASRREHILAEMSSLNEYDLNIVLNIVRGYKNGCFENSSGGLD